MAKYISERLQASYRFPNLFSVHIKIKTSALRRRLRKGLRSVLPLPNLTKPAGGAVITNALEQQSAHYQTEHWAFVDQIWDSEFHKNLVSHWPPNRYLNPIKSLGKAYDTGMIWNRSVSKDLEYLSEFPAIEQAYRYLISDGFCERVTNVCGDNVRRRCYQLRLTRSFQGSHVIPHVDTLDNPYFVNMIFFVDGNDGGLGIWNDNELQDPIFIPQNLRNSCLMYDMSESFYHGFGPMRLGTFRWTINAAYDKV